MQPSHEWHVVGETVGWIYYILVACDTLARLEDKIFVANAKIKLEGREVR